MGFFFTLLYIVTAYITPTALFGPLAEYRVQVFIVSLAIIFSIPGLSQSKVANSRQAFAILALSGAMFLSVALTGWVGGGISTLYGFLQTEIMFFLVAINCKKRRHLQIIVAGLFLCSTVFILLGMRDLYNQVTPSAYIYGDGALRRIRGLGFVNDPNDLAQVLVSLIPAVFLWKRPGLLLNCIFVGVPISFLLVGLYFTHSRGGMVALTAVVLISARRKLGTIPASVLAGLLFVGGLAGGWSGGRDVSVDSGADRLDLWAAGLAMVRAHPLFGIGIGGFADANGITAHNSVVICAAETGMIGLFCWTMLLFCSFRESVLYDRAATSRLAGQADEILTSIHSQALPLLKADTRAPSIRDLDTDSTKGFAWNTRRFAVATQSHRRGLTHAPTVAHHAPVPVLQEEQKLTSWPPVDRIDTIAAAEVSGIIRILIASFAGFLTAGWFLSRAFSIWLFMYCGMLYAVSRMGSQIGLIPSRDPKSFTWRWSFAVTLGLIILIYVILRLRKVGL